MAIHIVKDIRTTRLPEHGYLRLETIVGHKKKDITGLIPMCRGSWYNGQKKGLYPMGIQLGSRMTLYKVQDIKDLMDRIDAGELV